MGDEAAIQDWLPKFEAWRDFALPLLQKGKAKDAFAKYPWFTTRGEPFARLEKPVREARFGLVTTGGYSIEGAQEPMISAPSFEEKTPQIRMIPLDVDPAKLRIDHVGYDHRFAEEDINVNLPLQRLRELAENGEIGSVTDEVPVLMGLQPHVAALIRETVPELVARFRDAGVEAALLVPS